MTRSRFALGAALMLALGGCRGAGHEGRPQATQHEEDEGHKSHEAPDAPGAHGHEDRKAHEKHDAHGGPGAHGHTAERFDPELAHRVRTRRCEHHRAILDCDECRYEVGAVQVPRELLDGPRGKLLHTTRVEAATVTAAARLTGEVAFDDARVVHITPLVRGVARRVHVALGDRVKRGQRLAEVASRELGQLRASLRAAEARLALARTERQRERRLHAEQISSAKERSRAETDFKRAQIELQGLRQQLRLLGGSGASGSGAGRLTIRAPRGGVVVAKHLVPGESVSPSRSIFTVADLSRVWVWANLYERDLAPLLAAKASGELEAEVTVAAFQGRTFRGTVDYVGATMDHATRTVKMRVAVQNPGGLLRPGMFAQLSLGLAERRQALTVPGEAVLSDEGQHFVFVRLDQRRFLRRDVQLGPRHGGRVSVLSGLRAGEEIVSRGAFLLKSDVLREKMGAGCAD